MKLKVTNSTSLLKVVCYEILCTFHARKRMSWREKTHRARYIGKFYSAELAGMLLELWVKSFATSTWGPWDVGEERCAIWALG